MFLVSASRTIGTSSPRSVSTATPMWTYFLRMISSVAMSIEALNCGNVFSAAATTLTAIAVTVRLPPAASASFEYFFRSDSSAVTSARSFCVTCGIVRQAAAHVLRGLLADTAHRLALDLAPAGEIRKRLRCRPVRRRAPPSRPAAGVCLDVFGRDPSVRTGAVHFLDLDAQLPGHPPHRWRGRSRRRLRRPGGRRRRVATGARTAADIDDVARRGGRSRRSRAFDRNAGILIRRFRGRRRIDLLFLPLLSRPGGAADRFGSFGVLFESAVGNFCRGVGADRPGRRRRGRRASAFSFGGGADADALPSSTLSTTCPTLTLSPVLTVTAVTRPATEVGTSIVALSVSSSRTV